MKRTPEEKDLGSLQPATSNNSEDKLLKIAEKAIDEIRQKIVEKNVAEKIIELAKTLARKE